MQVTENINIYSDCAPSFKHITFYGMVLDIAFFLLNGSWKAFLISAAMDQMLSPIQFTFELKPHSQGDNIWRWGLVGGGG